MADILRIYCNVIINLTYVSCFCNYESKEKLLEHLVINCVLIVHPCSVEMLALNVQTYCIRITEVNEGKPELQTVKYCRNSACKFGRKVFRTTATMMHFVQWSRFYCRTL